MLVFCCFDKNPKKSCSYGFYFLKPEQIKYWFHAYQQPQQSIYEVKINGKILNFKDKNRSFKGVIIKKVKFKELSEYFIEYFHPIRGEYVPQNNSIHNIPKIDYYNDLCNALHLLKYIRNNIKPFLLINNTTSEIIYNNFIKVIREDLPNENRFYNWLYHLYYRIF